MAWLRLDDVGYDDPLVLAIGNAAYGASVRLAQYASAQRTNGWVPASKVREIASKRELDALLNVHIGDRPPTLHQHGDECRCLEGKDWGPGKGGYWIHAFLDRNPSREENDVHRAKRRELRDKELRHAVKERDGDLCRYCGITVKWSDRKTARGGVLDHVDPRIADGAANLVVACRGCNGRKKDNTVAAAGMTLHPIGTTAEDLERIRDGSTTVADPDLEPDPDPDPDPELDRPRPPGAAPGVELHVIQGAESPELVVEVVNNPMTDGTGRGTPEPDPATPTGTKTQVGPANTPRSNLAPNPYLRSHTSNPHQEKT